MSERIEEIKKDLAATTPGEWWLGPTIDEEDDNIAVWTEERPGASATVFAFDPDIYVSEADANFVADSRENISYLISLAEEYGNTIERQGQEMIRLQNMINKQLKELEEAQQLSAKWEKAFDNADKQYLKMEHEAAELRRQLANKAEKLAEAQQTIARQSEALKFYANHENYGEKVEPGEGAKWGPWIEVMEDNGERAKQALGE